MLLCRHMSDTAQKLQDTAPVGLGMRGKTFITSGYEGGEILPACRAQHVSKAKELDGITV